MAADFTQTRIDMLRRRWRETTSPHVSLQLADLYRQQGSLADAVEVLEGGLTGNPESVSLRVALGRYRMEAGDSAGAAATLRAVVDSDPSHLVANKLLVKAYVLLGERQRARDRLDLYSLLNDSDPEIEALEKSVAAGRAYFDAPQPAKAAETVPPFELPGPPQGPAPDLTRVPRPPAAAPTLRRSADGRILWFAAREPFPEAGRGLGDPRDWSALAAGGLFEAPAARPNGRPVEDGMAAALAARRVSDEEAAARRRADHVEIRLRSREASTEELREAAAPPVTAQQPTEAPPTEPPTEKPPTEEPPTEEPPTEEPPIEEPDEPPVEEPDEPRPGIDEPEPERPPMERPEGEPTVEEVWLGEVLEAEERAEAEAPRPTLTLARLYLEQGHLEEAEETFRAVLLCEPGNEQARLGLSAVVERRLARATPAPETEDREAELEILSAAGTLETAAGEEVAEAAGTPAGELSGWPVGGEGEGAAAAGAIGSAEVTLDDEPELRLPRSDEEAAPDARAAIRRRIGVLKTYLDGLRAARSAEGR
jgi:tetratricopeptide (TPR) repeat protein